MTNATTSATTRRTMLLAAAATWLTTGLPGLALGCPEARPARVLRRVNINAATRAELMNLAGMTPAVADRILAYRDAHGHFRRVQDLERVGRAGRAVIEQNPHRLAVR